jgi:assimilatory nitrate reductase catalytic subunit
VPGSDLVVLLALTHVLVDEGLVDENYVDHPHHRLGCRACLGRAVVARARGGGVRHPGRHPARHCAAARGRGAGARRPGRLRPHRAGLEQSTQGTDGVSAAINLAVALGLPGRPGSGYGPLTGQGNGQGGREHGLKSDQLPATG